MLWKFCGKAQLSFHKIYTPRKLGEIMIFYAVDIKVNVKFYPSATTEDITDHLRPTMRKKPDVIIIHVGNNDLTNDVNTMKYVRSITKIIEEMKGGEDIQGAFSGIIERRDHELGEKIKKINERLKRFCNSKAFLFVDNSNVDENSKTKVCYI